MAWLNDVLLFSFSFQCWSMCESLLNDYEVWKETCSKKTICVSNSLLPLDKQSLIFESRESTDIGSKGKHII